MLRNCAASVLVLFTFTVRTNIAAAQAPPTSRSLGPVLPEDIKLPPNPISDWASRHDMRVFGWANGGYTGSSTGEGVLRIEPRPNRFGDSWLLNQAAFVIERPHTSTSGRWGFRAEFYMGADAALLRPVNGFGPTNPRFGTDFRQAYFSIHAGILTVRGVDFKLGRQYVPLGYETTMAPYRPMYSEAYVWFYSQNGATTGAIATIHVSEQLDVLAGVTLGVNSLFELQGRAPSYIARGLYWFDSNQRTKLVGTVYTGPKPLSAAAGHIGRWQTEIEGQLIRNVNQRLTVVSETNVGWDARDPANNFRTSDWFGTYGMAIAHAHHLLDINFRAEWFNDSDGARIGTPGNFGEITAGVNFMPAESVNFRPEIRWDVAGNPAFGHITSSHLQSHQWTYAFEMLVKF